MKHKMFLIVPALVLLFLSAFKMEAQVGLSELDPNIIWVADSTIGIIDGFTVHPNGNIFAYKNGTYEFGKITRELKVLEIDVKTGKLIRVLPKFTKNVYIESMDISDDGKYLVTGDNRSTSIDGIRITELSTGISKTIGEGTRVKFIPSSSQIYFLNVDSYTNTTIIILDWEKEHSKEISVNEGINQISFSNDGRFFATGGCFMNFQTSPYTSLKLWDAKTNKLIKELYRDDKQKFSTFKVQFSPDSKSVAFLGNYNICLKIFDTESYNQVKHFDEKELNLNFTFISNQYIGIQSKITSIIRLSDYKRVEIQKFQEYVNWIETNTERNILFSGIGHPLRDGSIIAFDLNKILSSFDHKSENTTIQASFQKGTLFISGLQETSNMVNLEIFDIQGRLVRKLEIQSDGTEIRLPLILQNGTYLLNITEGQNQYSAKFLVTE